MSLAFDGIRALDDVSFDVARGEVCALIGPNGAGKSSMLNVVSGLYDAQPGAVLFEGQPLRRSTRALARRGIARTFQNIALFRGMTVLENVALGSDFRGAGDLPRASAPPRPRRRAKSAARATRPRTSSPLLEIASAIATTSSAACPTACRSASSSRAHWRHGRSCSCSTSRWPG